MINNTLRICLLSFFIIVYAFSFGLVGAAERTDGKYATIVDEAGNTIYITARTIDIGDEVLTQDNKRYEVISINGDTAVARLVGEVNLSFYLPEEPGTFAKVKEYFWPTAYAAGKKKVAIYHTHSDESYVPTDNAESIRGNGGIYKVGATFKSALENNGLEAIVSNANHDPHDNMAYERSRRTALSMIKAEKPDAIFDVHRDAVPAEVYAANVNGQDVAGLQLVVGKYGPTSKQIEEYALKIKAAADKKTPGLIKGIFFAKGGDYNQDLHPRAMLIEAGTYTNSRTSAEKGITMFAEVVPTVLDVKPQNKKSDDKGGLLGTVSGDGGGGGGLSGAAQSILAIIGVAVLGTIGYLFVSTGSFNELKGKLNQFMRTEFANFLGPIKRIRRKKSSDNNDNNSDDNKENS